MKLYLGIRHDEYGNSSYIISEEHARFGYLHDAIFISDDMKKSLKKILKKNNEHQCQFVLVEQFPMLDYDVLNKLSEYQPIAEEPLSDFFYHRNIVYQECIAFIYENFRDIKSFHDFIEKASVYIIDKYKLKPLKSLG